MFDIDSFNDLKSVTEVKAAVIYLAHNEVKYRQQLADSGLDYEDIQDTVRQTWLNLLKLCKRYNYSDYIVQSKEALYK
jgi:hypothetical protein